MVMATACSSSSNSTPIPGASICHRCGHKKRKKKKKKFCSQRRKKEKVKKYLGNMGHYQENNPCILGGPEEKRGSKGQKAYLKK